MKSNWIGRYANRFLTVCRRVGVRLDWVGGLEPPIGHPKFAVGAKLIYCPLRIYSAGPGAEDHAFWRVKLMGYGGVSMGLDQALVHFTNQALFADFNAVEVPVADLFVENSDAHLERKKAVLYFDAQGNEWPAWLTEVYAGRLLDMLILYPGSPRRRGKNG